MSNRQFYPKQLLSVLLAVLIALTLIPLQAAASAASTEDSFTLTEDASGYGWTYSAAARTLTLDGAGLTYSGSGSLFNFADGSDVNVAITGYNFIDLRNADEGASVFSCPNGTISIKSTGILCINNFITTNKVHMISAETSAVIDGGYYYTYAFKAADEDSSVTINSGSIMVFSLSEAGSRVTVNGGYIWGVNSAGDVEINGGIVRLDMSAPNSRGFISGSLTYSNCIVDTLNIDRNKCNVSDRGNAVLIETNYDDGGTTSVTADRQQSSPVELSGEVTGGLYADTYQSTEKHSIIRSGAKLKGAFYFSSGNVTVEAGADLSEATLYVSSPYNVSKPALVFDGNSGSGNIACGTICAYDCSDLKLDSVAGIKIQGSARITGGDLIGLSRLSIGVDISADGGSISGTHIIGISPISTSPSDIAVGVKLNSCFDADPTSSVIGYGDSIYGYENRDGGGVTLGQNATQLPDCTISTKGKDGADFVLTTPLKFDMENGSDSIYGKFDPNQNCSGKGWKYFKDSFGEYDKFLSGTDGNHGLLVLDELRYVTTIDNAAIEITGGNIDIDGLVIVVKGECLLKNMGKGIYSDIPAPVLLVGYDESAKLSVQSKYPNEKKDHPDHNIENAVYTSGDLTIKDLAIDVSANALQKQMIYAGNDLIVMNSNITSDLNPDSITSENFRPLCSGKDMYIVGSNMFTFVGKDGFYFTSESGSIYTSIFKLNYGRYTSHTAENYNPDIISGKEIKEISSNEFNKSFSTVAFDFNEEKYDVSISDDKSVVTLTDKTPAVHYGGDTFEVNADDLFVGGNMNYTLNSGSLSSTDLGGSYDPGKHIFSCAPINEDGDYTVSLTYHNKIDDTSESAGVNLLTGLPENVTVEYKFKVEKTPEVNVTYNAEGGEVTVSPERVTKGGDAEVVVTPKEGWRVRSVKADGADRELTDGRLLLTNIISDTNVEVEFEAIPKYKITVTTEGSGKVTPETSEFYEGGSAEFTVTPDKGYYVKSVTVDGNPVELTDGKYTFSNITEEHTLSVVFEKQIYTYDLTVECGANGKASLTSMTDVEEGTVLSCVLTPDAGYEVRSVTLNGKALSVKDNKFSFKLDSDSVLRIEFAKKSSGGSGGSGSSGSPSGGARPRPSTPAETGPAINGIRKNWADIAADIAKLPAGSAVVINMNGETSVPADVIKAVRDIRAKVEFVVDSTRSWVVGGANMTAVSAADFSMLPGNADRSALRGVTGADIMINGTGVPAELKLTFRKEFAGQFANLYKLTDGGLEFQNCAKVDDNGIAILSGANAKGEYIAMVCGFSDRPGDMNNDGILNALDASAILKSVIGTETGANPQSADLNGDGVLNALDASAILKWIVAA